MLNNHWQYSLKTFLAFLLRSDWSEQKTSDIFILTSIQLRDELQQRKRHIKKINFSNASDKFFKRMWLPQLIYWHVQMFCREAFLVGLSLALKGYEKDLESPKTLKDLQSQKICEKNWKTYQKFVRQKK